VFLAHAPGAADTFARAILDRFSAGQNQPETNSR
jgi:hypothetical protein